MQTPVKANRPAFKRPPTEFQLYVRVLILGGVIWAATYFYTAFQSIPSPLNKSAADTAVILMGLSMLLSSLCYFWNVFDTKIVYRKQLGLVGFGLGVLHLFLSLPAFKSLFVAETWAKGTMWPALTGVIALMIFTIMAVVSNSFVAKALGGKLWRYILRTGYLAMIFVWLHVVLLKSGRWATWFTGGMKSLPSMSLLTSIFILIVLIMRIALWLALIRKKNSGEVV